MKTVVVREYARLTTDEVPNTVDQATVTPSAFEWLCNFAAGFSKSGASLLHLENRRWLRLDSHVGVIETPCGTLLEILPKHAPQTDDTTVQGARALMVRMLAEALDLPVRSAQMSNLATFQHPLLEWVMLSFVRALDHLVKRGLRFDYQRMEEEQRFLRGQLDVVKQMRQQPGRRHLFNIRHDLFLPDRPENRLLKSALTRVCGTTTQAETWRMARELAGLFEDMPASVDTQADFRAWRNDRLMAHYTNVRPWCELILGQHMPLAVRGSVRGVSLLFPMEKLFERYVERCLSRQLTQRYQLKAQARSEYLCLHEGQGMFQLRPDYLLLEGGASALVLDAKWKLLNMADQDLKYGLSQGDFYQMFAYGHKYLGGAGDMVLIFPKWQEFDSVLPGFEFAPGLRLWVAPFDLEAGVVQFPPELIDAGVVAGVRQP
ncbi:McrC family protein [Massilia sp. SR12]